MDLIDHERVVLHHFLAHHEQIADIMDRVRVSMFTTNVHARLYRVLVAYSEQKQCPMTSDSLIDAIEQRTGSAGNKEVLVRAILDVGTFEGSTAADLSYSIDCLKTHERRRRVTDAMQSCLTKIQENDLVGIRGDLLAMLDAVQDDGKHSTIVNAGHATVEARSRYQNAKMKKEPPGIATGFPTFDQITRGLRRKHMWVLAGYTSQGKTAMGINWAYWWAMVLKKRGLYVTLEMTEHEIQTLLHARHSCERGTPLLVDQITCGELSPGNEKVFEDVLKEFGDCDLEIWEPGRITMDDIRTKVSALQLVRPFDFIIIDYLQLVAPNRDRADLRVEVGDLFRECKRLARTEEVGIVALHQMSRDGFKKALERGHYIMPDLSESAEVERNADLVFWTLIDDGMRANNEMRSGIMKNRHGRVMPDGQMVYTGFQSSLIAERADDLRGTDVVDNMLGENRDG